MKKYGSSLIIGVDAGYGNMKTAGSLYPTGLTAMDTEPMFEGDILKYNGIWYRIGEGHKPFIDDKTEDDDFYILTLASVACELSRENITHANVILAVGLPTTWTKRQKNDYREYMLKNQDVQFTFRKKDYRIHFTDCLVFPQGYSAAIRRIDDDKQNNGFQFFGGLVMMADIGNGTMNIMRFVNGKPDERFSWTEKLGVNQCVLSMKKRLMDAYGLDLPDETIEQFLRTKKANLPRECLVDLDNIATRYVAGLFDSLRSHGYDHRLMKLFVVGGGGSFAIHPYPPLALLVRYDCGHSAHQVKADGVVHGQVFTGADAGFVVDPSRDPADLFQQGAPADFKLHHMVFRHHNGLQVIHGAGAKQQGPELFIDHDLHLTRMIQCVEDSLVKQDGILLQVQG